MALLFRIALAISAVLLIHGCSPAGSRPSLTAAPGPEGLSRLPSPAQARKAAAFAGDFAANGNAFDAGLSRNVVPTAISAARFEPEADAAAPELGQLAWAIYKLDTAGYDRGDTLSVIWSVAPPLGTTFIGVAETAGDRWRWIEAIPTERYDVVIADHTAADGSFLVAVVMLGDERPVLSRVSLGNAGHWVRSWGSPGEDDTWQGLFVDSGDNIFACGSTDGFTGDSEALVVRWRTDGHFRWARTFGIAGASFQARDFAVAPTGDVYLTGRDAEGFNDTETDILVVKINTNGTLGWQKRLDLAGEDSGEAIAILSDGNIIVAGELDTNIGGAQDVAILRFSPAGTLLSQQRVNGLESESTDDELATFPDGTAWVTFRTRDQNDNQSGRLVIGSDGVPTAATSAPVGVPNAAGEQWLVSDSLQGLPPDETSVPILQKRDTGGQQDWVRRLDLTPNDENGWKVHVDAAGNSYVTGRMVSLGERPYFLRFDSAGNVTGSLLYNQTGECYALATDSRSSLVASISGEQAAFGDWQFYEPEGVTNELTEILFSFNIDFTTEDIGAEAEDADGVFNSRGGVLDFGGGDFDCVVAKRDGADW
jgi:hypothetical protein